MRGSDLPLSRRRRRKPRILQTRPSSATANTGATSMGSRRAQFASLRLSTGAGDAADPYQAADSGARPSGAGSLQVFRFAATAERKWRQQQSGSADSDVKLEPLRRPVASPGGRMIDAVCLIGFSRQTNTLCGCRGRQYLRAHLSKIIIIIRVRNFELRTSNFELGIGIRVRVRVRLGCVPSSLCGSAQRRTRNRLASVRFRLARGRRGCLAICKHWP